MNARGRTALLAVVLGAGVGAISAVYLLAVHGLEHLLWEDGDPRLPLPSALATVLTCAAGGVLVGLIRRRHERGTPRDLDDALADLETAMEEGDATPPPTAVWLIRSAILGVVSLGFGASLGPEAPLVAIAVGFGARIATILRLSRAEATYISAAGALSGLFGGPLGPALMPLEGGRSTPRAEVLAVGTLSGLAGLVTLLALLPDEGGPHLDVPTSTDVAGDVSADLLWAVLAALPATLIGLAALGLLPHARGLAERALPSTVLQATAGGLVLGLCGAVSPLALFSGSHGSEDLIADVAQYSAWALLGLAGLKLLATVACMSTGWFGGQIFPAVFMGLAVGLAVAAAFPGAPMAPAAAAGTAAAGTAVLRRPLAVVLILLFYFPADHLLAMLVGGGVATLLVTLLGERAPKPHGLASH
ncbi:chloride channel protein [Nocardioides sambongensis]|uniref:chloride channel protein n=1 Tax=Nocardioides sambongensis TaxID=2589074 RepID=UPI00112C02CC|nr:chloride channel protein [Nocardioides sambongensis]